MTANLERKDRGINDADVLGVVNHHGRVDDTTHRAGHHSGGTNGVEVGAGFI